MTVKIDSADESVAAGPSNDAADAVTAQSNEQVDGAATVLSRAANGMQAPPVQVEVHLSSGLPQFSIVGLPETAVRESRQRVRSALIQCGYDFPMSRITANLAPADLPKTGTRFDLPIAIGILVASGQVTDLALGRIEFIGELGLSGDIRAVGTVLSTSLSAREAGHTLCLPRQDNDEAALASRSRLITADTLPQLLARLCRPDDAAAVEVVSSLRSTAAVCETYGADMADVVGHVLPKRALEIAAAGGHGMLMIGPPGCGKSMLALRLPTLLPPMAESEAIETARIHSLTTNGIDFKQWRIRPFRAPHHSASAAALVGGGRWPLPGEVSLAHNGVLFLDEMPEFGRAVLEQLREPMETGGVAIARALAHTWYPARFQLIGAMNPCPCGWAGERSGRCRCSVERIEAYRGKVSGPLLDRLDLHINVNPIAHRHFESLSQLAVESSQDVRERVIEAHQRQLARGEMNSRLGPVRVLDSQLMKDDARKFLADCAHRRELSTRSHHRVFRVARTIADLAGEPRVVSEHVAEALSLRCLDRHVDGGG